MRARVDGAIKDDPVLKSVYHQIKKGTIKGLSVGGFFKRKLTEAGRRITDMDFTEISVTGVPTHAKPAFMVVAGKALEGLVEPTDDGLEFEDASLEALTESLQRLSNSFTNMEGKAVKGDPQDLYFLALILELEQMSNHLASSDDVEGEDEGGPSDERVDSLIQETKDGIDGYAREAHKLAAKLGPLPKISYT
jgi:hypothetical protein